jgi:hypothetical protein
MVVDKTLRLRASALSVRTMLVRVLLIGALVAMGVALVVIAVSAVLG